jgi:Transposase DDE domain
MATAEAKQISTQRAATIETANGELKTQRGMGRFLVRGLKKARCVALWSVLAYHVVHLGVKLLGATS